MTTIIMDTPEKRAKVQAIFLRGHLALLAKGMKSRQLTLTRALHLAAQLTGKTYPRSARGAETARADLNAFIWQANDAELAAEGHPRRIGREGEE